jgi:hypothetical protein
MEFITLGKSLYKNIHRPLNDYLRGRPSETQKLGIHTGEPYPITDRWTENFSGQVYDEPARSKFV